MLRPLILWSQVVPRHVLAEAHGFVIFTVVKAGFVFSARAGSGIVIARLPDGSEYRSLNRINGPPLTYKSFAAWSAPSAIGTGGMGFGGQMGAGQFSTLCEMQTILAESALPILPTTYSTFLAF